MIALVAFVVVAFAAEPAAAATASVEPTATELRARNRAAAGSERPESERESWIVRSSGLTGTLEVVRAGTDRSARLALGPFRTQRGIFRGQRWHQNDNGETVLERPEPSALERMVSETVTRLREPADAWAVTTTFASGHTARAIYDARSFLLIRNETTGGGRTTRTTFDDFRTDGRGRTRATHFFGNDDRPGTEFDYRLARDDSASRVDPAELAVPADRRALVEFPAGITTVRLPARIERGRIYVRLDIAGRELDFLLDSGAASITLDERVARALGLPGFGRAAETVAGTFTTERVTVPALGLGPLRMHDVVMRTGPIAANEGPHTRVVGLLGFDFFDAVGLKIDYAAGSVDAFAPGTWLPPAGTLALPVRLNAQIPVTTVTAGEATGDDFIIDTGAQFDLVLFQRFMRAHGATVGTATNGQVRYGAGVGGSFAYRTLAVKRLTLGPLELANPAAVLALAPDALGFDSKDGLVGSGVLERFSVFFDYTASRVYLGPRANPVPARGALPRASAPPLRSKPASRPAGP